MSEAKIEPLSLPPCDMDYIKCWQQLWRHSLEPGQTRCKQCGQDVTMLIDHQRHRYGGCPTCHSFETVARPPDEAVVGDRL